MNPHDVKVADPVWRCPWCDGTGFYAYAARLAGGDEYRPCKSCNGTGKRADK